MDARDERTHSIRISMNRILDKLIGGEQCITKWFGIITRICNEVLISSYGMNGAGAGDMFVIKRSKRTYTRAGEINRFRYHLNLFMNEKFPSATPIPLNLPRAQV